MTTVAVWVITLVGAALMLAGGTQAHRPRTAGVLIVGGLIATVAGSLMLWARMGAFG